MFLGLQFKLALEVARLRNHPCFWDAVQACSRRGKARKSSVFLGLQFKRALEGLRLGNHPCFWDCSSSLL